MPSRKYLVFGLVLDSEIPLPELFPASNAAAADIEIRLGPVASGHNISPESVTLVVPKVASYRISGGNRITVDVAPGASERNVRLFLLGSSFGALIHQRGLLPLHANAIEIDGRAVAFMGHSGAGKSTMAAWFLDRGYRVLADDVCVVTMDPRGHPLAHRGIPRLRLWREALEKSGRTSGDYELAFDDTDKYNVPTPQPESVEPLPLSHVYLLQKAESEGDGRELRLLKGVEAVDAIVANTYRGGYLREMGQTKVHLTTCLGLVRHVPVYAAKRLWGFDRYDEQAEALEAHARETVLASQPS